MFIKIIIIILSIIFLLIGLEPNINSMLHESLTFTEYGWILTGIGIVNFILFLFHKFYGDLKKSNKDAEKYWEFKKYKKEQKHIVDKNFYYRDLPFNKNLFKIFWIAYQYGIIKNRASILNALLLKWSNEGRIKFLKKSKYEIINNNLPFNDNNEADLFNILKHSNQNKFVKLSWLNYNAVFKEIDDIFLEETENLKRENKIINYEGEDIISSTIKEDVDIVFGFRNFLVNFGNIKDKAPNEVELWDEYLIYAELLDISDKVKKEFKSANINYSSREAKFKRINKRVNMFFLLLLPLSFGAYFVIFIVYFFPILYGYIWITWYWLW